MPTAAYLLKRRKIGAAVVLAAALLVAAVLAAAATRGRRQGEPAGEPQSKAPPAGDHRFDLNVDGRERQYVVHVPPGYDGRSPVPVVVMLHGGGGTARAAMEETNWTATSDQYGFLAVFPEGTRPDPAKPASFTENPQTWNDGSDRTVVGAARRDVDDVRFLSALIDDLSQRFTVDDRRVYVAGFSNGASMAFRADRELSGRIGAIAAVAGADWLSTPPPDRALSLLYITGTADPLNPVERGAIVLGSRPAGTKPPVKDQIERWVGILDCPSLPAIRDENGVTESRHGPCGDGAEVVLYTVEGMGHTWPGGKSLLPEGLVGKTSDRLDANTVIWQFFTAHPKR